MIKLQLIELMNSQESSEGKVSQNTKIIQVYVRNYKKIAILIKVQLPINNYQLITLVASKVFLHADSIALFNNGKRIKQDGKSIELKDKSIIHMINLHRTMCQTLTLNFKQANKPDKSLITFNTSSKTQIKNLIKNDLKKVIGKDEREIFLVYLGRPINIFKTFEEQLIENQCEIMIIEFKNFITKHLEIEYSNHQASIDTTHYYGMPSKGSRAFQPEGFNFHKTKHNATVPEETAYPKPETTIKPHKENAAPGDFYGFDPHSQDHAPPLIPLIPLISVQEQAPNVAPNSQKQPKLNTALKEKDLVYYGNPVVEQSENVIVGSVVEYKKMFLKKKSGSEHSQNSQKGEKK